MFYGIAGPDQIAGVALLLNCCGVKLQPILSYCHYSFFSTKSSASVVNPAFALTECRFTVRRECRRVAACRFQSPSSLNDARRWRTRFSPSTDIWLSCLRTELLAFSSPAIFLDFRRGAFWARDFFTAHHCKESLTAGN